MKVAQRAVTMDEQLVVWLVGRMVALWGDLRAGQLDAERVEQ